MKLNEAPIIEKLENSEYITVVLIDGAIGKIRKDKLLTSVNYEYTTMSWSVRGWHRIAISTASNAAISSAFFNIGNSFGTTTASSSCFYFAGSGYADRIISSIGKVGIIFPRVRVLYKPSTAHTLYIDIYYDFEGRNNIYLSASTVINMKFTSLDDSIATIPEGYTAQEFAL